MQIPDILNGWNLFPISWQSWVVTSHRKSSRVQSTFPNISPSACLMRCVAALASAMPAARPSTRALRRWWISLIVIVRSWNRGKAIHYGSEQPDTGTEWLSKRVNEGALQNARSSDRRSTAKRNELCGAKMNTYEWPTKQTSIPVFTSHFWD